MAVAAQDVAKGQEQLPSSEIVKYGILTWLPLSFIVLFCGLGARFVYSSLMTPGGSGSLDWPSVRRTLAWLALSSLLGALAFTAFLVAWRLGNRVRDEARWAGAAVVLVVILFVLFVWPTPYTYRYVGSELIRIHRVTGLSEKIP